MTLTDLRVKFKLDTGEYPVWVNRPKMNNRTFLKYGWERVPDNASFKGKVKSIYGWWLEEKLGNPRKLRDQYQKDEGVTAVYPPPNRRSMFEGFRCSYTLWLERKLLDNLNAR